MNDLTVSIRTKGELCLRLMDELETTSNNNYKAIEDEIAYLAQLAEQLRSGGQNISCEKAVEFEEKICGLQAVLIAAKEISLEGHAQNIALRVLISEADSEFNL